MRRSAVNPQPATRDRAAAGTLLLALCLAFLLACQGNKPPRAPVRQPNLILIVVDALRAANVSFLGYHRDTTPHLAMLAAESHVFDHAVSVGGNTPAAMSALMTGRYAFTAFAERWSATDFGMHRFYLDDTESGLPRSLPTLAEQLHAAGYATAGFITNPYLKKIFNFHRGFDHYGEIFRKQDIPYGKAGDVSRSAIDFLGSGTAQPFFLYLHFMDTHGPYSPPDTYRTRYQDGEPPPGGNSDLWQTWEKRVATLPQPEARALADHMLNLYDGALAYVDDSIGLVLQALADRGLSDDTVIVMTADHGEEFLEHGGTTHKGTLYEELVHVPTLIYLPWAEGGRINDLVRNFDLMPTLLDLAGIDTAEQGLDAVSLRPLLEGADRSLRLTAYAGNPSRRMLRSSRYKLILRPGDRKEFYDLVEDPTEQHNLYPAVAANNPAGAPYAPTMAGMELKLARLAASLSATSAADAPESAMDQTTIEQLRALGYLD